MNDVEQYDRLGETTRAWFLNVLEAAREQTKFGKSIDEHQVMTRKLAGWATRLEALQAIWEYADWAKDKTEYPIGDLACLFGGETIRELAHEVPVYFPYIDMAPLESLIPHARETVSEDVYRNLGRWIIEFGTDNNLPILVESSSGEDEQELRYSTRKFAREAVAPLAESIHRDDLLVPGILIEQMSEMGYFGMSVPEEFGGVGMSNLMMILATEELSAASLPAAGSLITRPEILTKALLKGGTVKQKEKWLPQVASGELMVAVAVTEPNVGSDVASVSCRAVPDSVDGKDGFLLNGAKAWCTFAGRANILALLARTVPDPGSGHKGLSLFIVEKDIFKGHEFEMIQPSGGRISGKADATLGYRGMHSFTLQFEDYFVPAENLVGEEDGLGKGFYLQMGGFTAGRLQTGGRAIGLSQACLDVAVQYTTGRPQFGQPISSFQSTEYEIGRMAVQLEASRQLTYSSARCMDAGDSDAGLKAAMAKLFACRSAVGISQSAQVLHGGWGYAEEYAISRYVADALVLPIFEGVEPILEMKVIGRALLSG